jgi:hypothetical protein
VDRSPCAGRRRRARLPSDETESQLEAEAEADSEDPPALDPANRGRSREGGHIRKYVVRAAAFRVTAPGGRSARLSRGPRWRYVVLVNRTLTDVLRGGALGGLKRKFGGDQVQKGVELALQQMQEGLEKAAGVR